VCFHSPALSPGQLTLEDIAPRMEEFGVVSFQGKSRVRAPRNRQWRRAHTVLAASVAHRPSFPRRFSAFHEITNHASSQNSSDKLHGGLVFRKVSHATSSQSRYSHSCWNHPSPASSFHISSMVFSELCPAGLVMRASVLPDLPSRESLV
jgi:hypothetical protein